MTDHSIPGGPFELSKPGEILVERGDVLVGMLNAMAAVKRLERGHPEWAVQLRAARDEIAREIRREFNIEVGDAL